MGPGRRKISELQEESKKIEKRIGSKRVISLREKGEESEDQNNSSNTQNINEEGKGIGLFEFVTDILQRNDPDEFFAQPVTLNVENYGKASTRVMDFGTIRAKIKENEYKSMEDFKNDVYLLCVSSMNAHYPNTKPFQVAEALLSLAKKIFDDLNDDTRRRFYLESLDPKTHPTAPSRKPQGGVQPVTIGHARFRRKVSDTREEHLSPNSEEVVNAPKPDFQLGGWRQYYNNCATVSAPQHFANNYIAPNLKAHDAAGANSSHVHVLPKPVISRPPQFAPQNQVSGFNTPNPSLGNVVWPASISRIVNTNYINLFGLNLPNQVPILRDYTEQQQQQQARVALGNSMAPVPVVHPMPVSVPQMFPYNNFAVRRNMHQQPEKKEEENEKEKGKEGNEDDNVLNLDLKL